MCSVPTTAHWLCDPFAVATVACGVMALALAAANLLAPAACAGGVVVIGVVACSVRAVYRSLPAAEQYSLYSRSFVRRVALGALLSAVIVSCFYWFGGWTTRPPEGVINIVAPGFRLLDFAPAMFAELLPVGWRSGFHQYFRDGLTYCFPGPFWWETMRYLRAAIPAYFIIFFAAAALTRLALGALRTRAAS
jgi:hypothetical protein